MRQSLSIDMLATDVAEYLVRKGVNVLECWAQRLEKGSTIMVYI